MNRGSRNWRRPSREPARVPALSSASSVDACCSSPRRSSPAAASPIKSSPRSGRPAFAGPPRAPLPGPKNLRFAEANSGRLEDLKLLPTKPDWAGGLRETWQPGEAAALARLGTFVDQGLSAYADGRNRHRHRRDIAPVASSPFRRDQPEPGLACRHARNRLRWRQCRSRRQSYLRELGWREFSYHLLHHFPSIAANPLRPEFADLPLARRPGSARRLADGDRPVTPSSTPPCASFGKPASCTTGRA